ncbi:cupin domain-containing protein [Ralstonia solanacearum]|uniref:Cupin domain-containing protein n=1 Tax=Ralstonia solanacearum TaxID=305 RepID=A0AAE3NEJ8_RALSL|nr:cupin domain-containing protein [Ralstonia solanacearum]KFX28557.1 sugar-binding protein [Ralstonia solanacearum]MBB6583603.1 cupin domain-containing protein [Ralstonia solanacearum]MDB0520475.1 cupin domain-containing protein [Ralstonia solanacearum]MDC6175994.1 cupin domain-containing protein [Ralstonia solanacearum]MDC6209635.1 cupin domain-containing protein [Ralstonia solanacearum]
MTRSPIRLAFQAPQVSETGLSVEAIDLDFLGAVATFEASRFEVAVGGFSPPEKHPEREIWMIAAGSGRLDYRGEVTEVRSGDCLTFDPDVEHSVHNTGTEPMRIFSVWWTERAP